MKILICGSMYFAKQMLDIKNKLEQAGHTVEVPPDTQKFIDEPDFTTDDHEADYKHCVETQVMKKHFQSLEKSDAILVLNYPKNNIDGYVGPATLMDIGLAYHFNKKIFLINPPPDIEKARYSHEISIMQPIILDGDVSKIN